MNITTLKFWYTLTGALFTGAGVGCVVSQSAIGACVCVTIGICLLMSASYEQRTP